MPAEIPRGEESRHRDDERHGASRHQSAEDPQRCAGNTCPQTAADRGAGRRALPLEHASRTRVYSRARGGAGGKSPRLRSSKQGPLACFGGAKREPGADGTSIVLGLHRLRASGSARHQVNRRAYRQPHREKTVVNEFTRRIRGTEPRNRRGHWRWALLDERARAAASVILTIRTRP